MLEEFACRFCNRSLAEFGRARQYITSVSSVAQRPEKIVQTIILISPTV
jgi:hypothetical protein